LALHDDVLIFGPENYAEDMHLVDLVDERGPAVLAAYRIMIQTNEAVNPAEGSKAFFINIPADKGCDALK
jgi:hypothetical protein